MAHSLLQPTSGVRSFFVEDNYVKLLPRTESHAARMTLKEVDGCGGTIIM